MIRDDYLGERTGHSDNIEVAKVGNLGESSRDHWVAAMLAMMVSVPDYCSPNGTKR